MLFIPSTHFSLKGSINWDFSKSASIIVSELKAGIEKLLNNEDSDMNLLNEEIDKLEKTGHLYTKEYEDFINKYPNCKRKIMLCSFKDMKERLMRVNLNDVGSGILLGTYGSDTGNYDNDFYKMVKEFRSSVETIESVTGDTISKMTKNSSKFDAKTISTIKPIFDKMITLFRSQLKEMRTLAKYLNHQFNQANDLIDIGEKISLSSKNKDSNTQNKSMITPEITKLCKENKVTRVRIILKDTVIVPEVTKENFYELVSYIEKNLKSPLYEKDSDDPWEQDKAKWTEELFNKYAVELVNNFTKEKLLQLYEMGQYLFKNKK